MNSLVHSLVVRSIQNSRKQRLAHIQVLALILNLLHQGSSMLSDKVFLLDQVIVYELIALRGQLLEFFKFVELRRFIFRFHLLLLLLLGLAFLIVDVVYFLTVFRSLFTATRFLELFQFFPQDFINSVDQSVLANLLFFTFIVQVNLLNFQMQLLLPCRSCNSVQDGIL